MIKEVRLNADIPESLKRKVDILAAEEGKTVKDLVIEALEDLLEKRKGQKKSQVAKFALVV